MVLLLGILATLRLHTMILEPSRYTPDVTFLSCVLMSREKAQFGKSRRNLVLLKTHKCASSTVQNIIMRYGHKHNLTFALPTTANYFGHPKYFNRIFVPDYPGSEFNLMAHHTRFHYQELSLMMPKDTVFVTIIRNPSELMESLYSYYLLDDYYKTDLKTLLKNKNRAFKTLGEKRYYNRLGINQMAFDLGMEPKDFLKEEVAQRFCDILERQFDLVMVAERMEESLILLMDLMNWTLDDVVFLKQNVRRSKLRSKLSKEEVRLLKKINIADEIIYDRFSKIFEKKVAEFGANRMKDMVQCLVNKNNEHYKTCVAGVVDDEIENFENKTKYGYRDRYMMHYTLKSRNNEACNSLLRSELEYTDILRKKQNKKRKVAPLKKT